MHSNTLLATLLLVGALTAGCRHSQPVTAEAIGQAINNSAYELVHTQLAVSAVGESRNHQMARDKSRAAALDSASAILAEATRAVADRRGMTPPALHGLRFVNTKTLAERTTATDRDDGTRLYRHYRTLAIEVEPLLDDIFGQLDPPDGYGRFAFLRDMDIQLDTTPNTHPQ